MKKVIYLFLLIPFLNACKHEKETAPVNQSTPQANVNPAAKLEDLTKIDTGAFLKENPHVRNKSMMGPAYENAPIEKRIYAYKSRVYFGSNGRTEGTLASKIMNALFQDTTGGKKINNMVESTELKFADGQSKLEGIDSDEMKIFALATYIPMQDTKMFNVNVNTKDAALRKERLNNFKQAMTTAGADISKFEFDENASPIAKEGIITFQGIKIKR